MEPITQAMLKLLAEHKEANKQDLLDRIIEGPSLGQQDIHLISQLKGQILVFDQLLDIKEFLLELVEEQNVEIQSIGSESLNQGK